VFLEYSTDGKERSL